MKMEPDGQASCPRMWGSDAIAVMRCHLDGKGGEVATNRLEDQELAVLSLHLLQICLVYVNTLIFQQVLSEPVWRNSMAPRLPGSLAAYLQPCKPLWRIRAGHDETTGDRSQFWKVQLRKVKNLPQRGSPLGLLPAEQELPQGLMPSGIS